MVLTVESNVANTITGLKIGGTAVNASNYSVSGLVLTIKKEYLSTLAEGDKTFTVTLAKSPDVVSVVTVEDTTE